MNRLLCLLLMIFGVSSASIAEECESAVDMADSLDFHKMHLECNQEPEFRYQPGSDDAINVYEQPAETVISPGSPVEGGGQAAPAMIESQPQSTKAGVSTKESRYNLREPFSLTGGPDSAVRGLFVQMAELCPAGWDKLAEWVEPQADNYFLYYQVRCRR